MGLSAIAVRGLGLTEIGSGASRASATRSRNYPAVVMGYGASRTAFKIALVRSP